MIHFEKRLNPSRITTVVTPIIAVILTMIAGGIMFAALGKPPLEAIRIIFWDPLFDPNFASYSRPQLLVKAGPLILIAIGLSIGFKAGIWNIGAEGQYIMGAVFGAAVALAAYPADSVLLFPAMVVSGAFGGWLWAMIPAILRTKFNTNEILVSLMLVYVAESILASVAQGLLKNPEGYGFPGSRNLQQYPSAFNAEVIANSGMHWGVISAFIAVICAYVMMTRTFVVSKCALWARRPKLRVFRVCQPRGWLCSAWAYQARLLVWQACSKCQAHLDKSLLISTRAMGSPRLSWHSWGACTQLEFCLRDC